MFFEPFFEKLFPENDSHVYGVLKIKQPTKPLFGYKPISNTDYYEQDPLQADIVKFIFDLVLKENLSATEIAKRATDEIYSKSEEQVEHKFHATTIINMIERPEYCGHCYSGKYFAKSNLYSKPIISLKEWEEAVRILRHRSEVGHGRMKQLKHPLSGFLKCEYCLQEYYHKSRTLRGSKLADFFQHSPYKDKNEPCDSDSYINAEKIEELTAMLFLKFITSKQYRKELINAFNVYEIRTYDRYGTAEILYGMHNLSVKISLFKYFVIDIQERKKFSNTFETLLSESHSSVNLLVTRFDIFTRNVIERWVRNKKADRFMILRTFFDQILVGKNKISFVFETQNKIAINYKNLPDKWNSEVKKLGKKTFPNDIIPNIDDNLDELLSYLNEKTAQQYYSDEYQSINEANQIQFGFFRSDQIPYKHYYERADFIDIKSLKIRLNALLLYQMNHEGIFYVDLNGDRREVATVNDSNTVLMITFEGKSYINSRYIHRLPEWFYGANFEYFKVGNERIAFIIEDEKVKAYKLPTRGVRKEISIEEALSLLKSQTDFDYRDID